MAWKHLKQRSFADDLLVEHAALTELDEVHDLLDWSRIELRLSEVHNKPRGEKAWPPLMMFKALLLQSWYALSDPQLEKQIARDLLFRRFMGLGLAQSVPDHSTLWRFRRKLEEHALQDSLFLEINAQLSDKGLYIKHGDISIVDASVIKAQRNRPNKGVDGHNTQDPEAAYNVKKGSNGKQQTTYGFKAHLNVDEDGFVKATDFTAGNVHDSQCFTELLSGDESQVYADSAYASEKTDQWLSERHIENGVLARAYRNRPLTKDQKTRNRKLSATRSIVERVFGIFKLYYGMGKARYLGLARNQTRFGVMCMAYNLKRGVAIQREIDALQENCA